MSALRPVDFVSEYSFHQSNISGDGNFHVLIFFKPDDPDEVRQAKHLATTMGEKAIALGGTCTGEINVCLCCVVVCALILQVLSCFL